MENLTLHLEEMDLPSGNSGNVGGSLYLSVGGAFFPEERWYDLVSAAFEHWLPRLISFASGHTDSCTLFFMDGPCSVKLNRSENGAVTAVCLWDSKVQIPQTEIDFPAFLQSIVKALREFRRISYENTGNALYGAELSVLKALLRQCKE